MPTTYEPFDNERFNRELETLMISAMKKACEDDRAQIISNIKSGVSPLGGPAKANSPETIRQKGSSTPLVGKGRTLLKKSSYPIVQIREPDTAGWALKAPPSREEALIHLAAQGYPVFWMDDTQVWVGTKQILQALQQMSDSFRGAPR
jgi:hypothetical protein